MATIAADGHSAGTDQFDVVVLGATAGGCVAAIAAAEEGAATMLVSENDHVGGMVSGGLGKSDIERAEHLIGGLARRFFRAVGAHYAEPIAYRFEPSVAEGAIRGMLEAAGVTVVHNRHLERVILDDDRRIRRPVWSASTS